jgi:hypothetical protein
MNQGKKQKEVYESPRIEVWEIQLEKAIADSGTVDPNTGGINEVWNEEEVDGGEIILPNKG